MNRRQLLLSSLGFLTGTALLRKTGLFSGACTAHFLESTAFARVLSRLFANPENASVVGMCYLKHYPERADKNLLLGMLGPEFAALAATDDRTLLTHIDALRRQDFIDGRTVIVNNCILSRTEASLCALVALS